MPPKARKCHQCEPIVWKFEVSRFFRELFCLHHYQIFTSEDYQCHRCLKLRPTWSFGREG